MDVPTVAWFIAIGFTGAFSRLCLQWYRDGEVTQTKVKMFALLFLGSVAGWVAFHLKSDYVAALSLGFMFPDVVENLAEAHSPVT